MAGLLLVGAASLALAFPAQAGEAEDREEAKRLYAEARKLRAQGDADGALERFFRAHELAPTPVTRLELARELEGRRRLVEAHDLAARVAELPKSATETQKSVIARREATTFAASLEARIAKLTVTVIPDGDDVELLVNGARIERAARTAPVRLDPGEHRAIARSGDRIVDLPFALVEGEQRSLRLELPPARPAPEPTPPEPVPPPSPIVTPTSPSVAPSPPAAPRAQPAAGDDFGPAVPIALTVGALGLAGGVVTGAIALSQKSSLEERCPRNLCPPDAHELLATHDALTTTSSIAFVVGGLATATGLVLWALEDDAPDAGASARRTSTTIAWTGTGLAVEGTW